MSSRRRYLARFLQPNALEMAMVRRNRLIALAALLLECDEPNDHDLLLDIAIIMILRNLALLSHDEELIPSPIRLPVLIENIDPADSWAIFRFRKEDLPRLLRVLQLNQVFRLENRCSVSGEEMLLLSLARLEREGGYHVMISHSGRNSFFGREMTQISRIVSCFLWHLFRQFALSCSQ